jgi:hypothetical protein
MSHIEIEMGDAGITLYPVGEFICEIFISAAQRIVPYIGLQMFRLEIQVQIHGFTVECGFAQSHFFPTEKTKSFGWTIRSRFRRNNTEITGVLISDGPL